MTHVKATILTYTRRPLSHLSMTLAPGYWNQNAASPVCHVSVSPTSCRNLSVYSRSSPSRLSNTMPNIRVQSTHLLHTCIYIVLQETYSILHSTWYMYVGVILLVNTHFKYLYTHITCKIHIHILQNNPYHIHVCMWTCFCSTYVVVSLFLCDMQILRGCKLDRSHELLCSAEQIHMYVYVYIWIIYTLM